MKLLAVTRHPSKGEKVENNQQVGGQHYKKLAIQPWDYVLANNLGYMEGSVIKYITRWQDKNGLEDLYKCRHFLNKLIEHQEKQQQIKEGTINV